MNLSDLYAEFPRDAVSWRAQTVNKDGSKALALAYIDARDVMDRLDTVVGPENWSDAYVETAKGRVICTLSIRVNGEWIAKTDGAGDTDVEGDKGAISDALKRAAVKWGIGRYLYALSSPWVPCESYERNGKRYWSKWTADPWSFVRGPAPVAPRLAENASADDTKAATLIEHIDALDSFDALQRSWVAWTSETTVKHLLKRTDVQAAKERAKTRLAPADPFGAAA